MLVCVLDMRIDMCVGMRVDMCVGMRVGMRVGLCADLRVGMYVDEHWDAPCHVYRSVNRHVC